MSDVTILADKLADQITHLKRGDRVPVIVHLLRRVVGNLQPHFARRVLREVSEEIGQLQPAEWDGDGEATP